MEIRHVNSLFLFSFTSFFLPFLKEKHYNYAPKVIHSSKLEKWKKMDGWLNCIYI